MLRTIIILLMAIVWLPLLAGAQDRWRLAQETSNMKIYHSTSHGNGFKKIKVDAVLDGSPERMMQIIRDVPGYKHWVYGHKTGTVLKQLNNNEFYFYTETTMPWPVAPRDAVVHARIVRDGKGGFTVMETSDPDYHPVKEGKVRVPRSFVKWVITPAGENKIRIQYHFEAEPGGTLPPWVVNLFADKGPVESFRKLAMLLRQNS